MAGLQHGTTIKTRTIPQDRIVADDSVFDMSTADDDTLMNVSTLKDIAEKLSTQKNLLVAKVMAVTNQVLTGVADPYIVDSVTLVDGEKILLTNQTDPTKNGLYTYNSSANTLVFSAEYTQLEEFISIHSTLVTITNGTVYSGYLLALTSSSANPTLGTNAVTFTQIGRFFIAGNGLKTENGITFGQVDPTSDTGLAITPDGFKLDHSQLPGAGGVPINSVPHPDIHSITGDIVREVNQTGAITINGLPFRRDAVVTSTGFTAGAYATRRSNQIVLAITAGNIAGLYDIVVTNNTLDSDDSGAATFTVIGSPTLVSVSPSIAAGETANLTIDGIGFLPLTTFNNAGEDYTINSSTYVNPTTYTVNLTIPSTLVSGDYDIQAVNDHASTSAYDSGVSGDELVQVRNGSLSITNIIGDSVNSTEPLLKVIGRDIGFGGTKTLTINGVNLYPSITTTDGDVVISSVTGGATQLVFDVNTSANDGTDIGVLPLTITDSITTNTITESNAFAINYPYIPFVTLDSSDFTNGTALYTFSGNTITKDSTTADNVTDSIRTVQYLHKEFIPSNHFIGEIYFEYDADTFKASTSNTFILFVRNRVTGDRAQLLNGKGGGGGVGSGDVYITIGNGSTTVGTSNAYTVGVSETTGFYKVRVLFEYDNGSLPVVKAGIETSTVPYATLKQFLYTEPSLIIKPALDILSSATELDFELFISNANGVIRNFKIEGRILT